MSLVIAAKVYPNREHAGKIEIPGFGSYDLCAKSSIPDKDPAEGTYKLLKVVAVTDPSIVASYGSHVLYFGSASGKTVALHGGETDEDGRLYPTNGSLRVNDEALESVLAAINGEIDIVLEVEEKHYLFAGATRTHISSQIPRSTGYHVTRSTSYIPVDTGYDFGDFLYDMFLYNTLFAPPVDDYYVDPVFEGQGGGFGGGGANGDYSGDPNADVVANTDFADPALAVDQTVPADQYADQQPDMTQQVPDNAGEVVQPDPQTATETVQDDPYIADPFGEAATVPETATASEPTQYTEPAPEQDSSFMTESYGGTSY